MIRRGKIKTNKYLGDVKGPLWQFTRKLNVFPFGLLVYHFFVCVCFNSCISSSTSVLLSSSAFPRQHDHSSFFFYSEGSQISDWQAGFLIASTVCSHFQMTDWRALLRGHHHAGTNPVAHLGGASVFFWVICGSADSNRPVYLKMLQRDDKKKNRI